MHKYISIILLLFTVSISAQDITISGINYTKDNTIYYTFNKEAIHPEQFISVEPKSEYSIHLPKEKIQNSDSIQFFNKVQSDYVRVNVLITSNFKSIPHEESQQIYMDIINQKSINALLNTFPKYTGKQIESSNYYIIEGEEKKNVVLFSNPTQLLTLYEMDEKESKVYLVVNPNDVQSTENEEISVRLIPFFAFGNFSMRYLYGIEPEKTARLTTKSHQQENTIQVSPKRTDMDDPNVPPPVAVSYDEDTIFRRVDVAAKYSGDWSKFLINKLEAKLKNVTYSENITINIEFVVDTDGTVKHVKALNGPDIMKEICEEVIRESGTWIPAKINGEPVKAYKIQKIVF